MRRIQMLGALYDSCDRAPLTSPPPPPDLAASACPGPPAGARSLREIRVLLHKLSTWRQEVDRLKVSHVAGCLYIDSKQLKAELLPAVDDSSHDLLQLLLDMARQHCLHRLEDLVDRVALLQVGGEGRQTCRTMQTPPPAAAHSASDQKIHGFACRHTRAGAAHHAGRVHELHLHAPAAGRGAQVGAGGRRHNGWPLLKHACTAARSQHRFSPCKLWPCKPQAALVTRLQQMW